MSVVHIKSGSKHAFLDEEIYNILLKNGLSAATEKYAIISSENYTERGKIKQIENIATDGEKLYVLSSTAEKPEKIMEELEEIPTTYPHIVFVNPTTFSTFVDLGGKTFFATFSKKYARIHIPGGEVNIPKKILKTVKINSIVPDLFNVVLDHGGTINTQMYSKYAYTKALEHWPELKVIPYYDIAIIIDKPFVYTFDGETVRLAHPFKLDMNLWGLLPIEDKETFITTLFLL